VLIDAVIDYFFKQNVNTILWQRTVAKLAYVHTWTKTDMLTPVERFDAVFGVVVSWGGHGKNGIGIKKDTLPWR
jgi:hypothetical protein